MPCEACRERGKTWEGSDPRCAFEAGVFSPDNWSCATLDPIREVAEDGTHPSTDYRWCDDQKYATLCIEGLELDSGPALALWVSWYKSRGATDALWLLDSGGAPRLPTEADCVAIAAYLGRV